jgi:YHS domain-containing protein
MKRSITLLSVGASALLSALASLPRRADALPPDANLPLAEIERMEAESIKLSLAWLARHQEPDGSWKATGQPGHGFERLYEPDAAKQSSVMATSLALLAFIGDGSSPWLGPYRETVKRGHEWLLAQQKASQLGALVPVTPDEEAKSLSERERAARRGHLERVNHLWGTIALLEVVTSSQFQDEIGSVKDAEKEKRRNAVSPAAMEAVRFITLDPMDKPERFDFHNPKTTNIEELVLLGAVRYVFSLLFLPGDKEWFNNCRETVDNVAKGAPELWIPYRYTEEGEYWFGGAISTAQMLMCKAWYFYDGYSPIAQIRATVPLLVARRPEWNADYEILQPSRHPAAKAGGSKPEKPAELPPDLQEVAQPWRDDIANEYSWFWTTMVVKGGLVQQEQVKWRSTFCQLAHRHQRRGGVDSGSWDPTGPHARVFGREATTAWMCISLQQNCRLRLARQRWNRLLTDPRWASRIENTKNQPVTREKCLVCDMEVMSNTAFSKGFGNKTFYFCSEEHQMRFEMDPEAWMSGEKPKEEGSEGSHK